jgi:hypothetical protein
LVAIKKTRTREGSHIRRIHYIPQFLAENIRLSPATPREFAFELRVPDDNASADQPVADVFKDLPIGNIVAGSLKTLPSHLEWSLNARVACPGLDLSEDKMVSVRA